MKKVSNTLRWHRHIVEAAIMLGIINGERTIQNAAKVRELLEEQIKQGKVEQIATGRYRRVLGEPK